jgi:hypothetical protein
MLKMSTIFKSPAARAGDLDEVDDLDTETFFSGLTRTGRGPAGGS